MTKRVEELMVACEVQESWSARTAKRAAQKEAKQQQQEEEEESESFQDDYGDREKHEHADESTTRVDSEPLIESR